MNRTSQVFGALDVLVNNAAYQMTHESIEEFRSGEWDLTFRTNIYAMFYLSKAPCRGYARVERSSTRPRSRHTSRPESCWHATTKGAIVTLTKALSELAIERGVRVNAVAPGPV